MQQCLLDEACVLQSQLLLYDCTFLSTEKDAVEALLSKYNGRFIDGGGHSYHRIALPSSSRHRRAKWTNIICKTLPWTLTLVHFVKSPHLLNTLMHRLGLEGVDIIECQAVGPCVLDIYSQSTLQPKPLHATSPTTARLEYSSSRRKLHDRIAPQLSCHRNYINPRSSCSWGFLARENRQF
jgi:hypothetical protein